MSGRQILLYFAWSRPLETAAPLTVIDDRFPAIFELRRLFYPKFEELADPVHVDQGISGFPGSCQKRNFAAFAAQAGAQTGRPVIQVERVADDGSVTLLDDALIAGVDTIVVISFDSLRTHQVAGPSEIEAVRRFLGDSDHLIFVCPHHDIGETSELTVQGRVARQTADFLSPWRQGDSPSAGLWRVLRGHCSPVSAYRSKNRFGLRPAVRGGRNPRTDRSRAFTGPAGLAGRGRDLQSSRASPQLERIEEGALRMDVLARQPS